MSRNIDPGDALYEILDWIDTGNPEPDSDDDNDLSELHGESFDFNSNVNLPAVKNIEYRIMSRCYGRSFCKKGP